MLANSLRRGRNNTNGRLQCASRLCCAAIRGGGRCGEDFRYMCDDARRGCFAVSAAGLRACCCGHGRICRCRGHRRHSDVNAEPTTQPRANGLVTPFMQTVAIESRALDRLERARCRCDLAPRQTSCLLQKPVTPKSLMPAPVLLSPVTRGVGCRIYLNSHLRVAVAAGPELEAYLAFASSSDNCPLARPAKSVTSPSGQLRPDVRCLSSGCTAPGGRVASS
jgi:hypothetical protein